MTWVKLFLILLTLFIAPPGAGISAKLHNPPQKHSHWVAVAKTGVFLGLGVGRDGEGRSLLFCRLADVIPYTSFLFLIMAFTYSSLLVF